MRRFIAPVIGLAMAAAACTGPTALDPTPFAPSTAALTPSSTTPAPIVRPGTSGVLQAVPAALRTFDACEDLLAHFQAQALEQVGPWGLDGYGYPYGGPVFERGFEFFEEEGAFRAQSLDIPAATTAAAEAPIAGIDYSTTNVQEVGVDEPDIVKTDGTRIIALAQGSLHYIDVSGDEPELTDSITLQRGWAQEIILHGDSVFVIAGGSRYGVKPQIGPNVWTDDVYLPYVETSLITEIDISDPDDMDIVRDLYLDGGYVTARAVDGVARVVVRSQPTGLEFTFPRGSGLRAEREAEQRNREVIEESTIENWLPYFVLEEHRGGTTVVVDEGVLVDCNGVHVPEDFAGLGLTSVLTIDLERELKPGASASVFAAGETVYASTESLFVATNRWVDAWALTDAEREALAEGWQTEIHKFDIADPDDVTYVATGGVPGYLLNQWAMSEHDGFLRVASTDFGTWWGFAPDRQSESYMTILEEDDGELMAVWQVDDLGRGEQIYSVRYVGDVGFVVTFRQVDPLYTIDLSDPFDPEVMGELKIAGYSAYLHPVGDGLLLGVGQDATDEGFLRGAQVSLFDVSDLSDPKRIDQIAFGDGNSEVEYDHRAFLYWAETGMAVLPVQRWGWDELKGTEDFFAGVVAVEVSDDGLRRVGTISHRDDPYYDWSPPIRRSLVIGDALFTMSDNGIKANDLGDLDELGFVSFFD